MRVNTFTLAAIMTTTGSTFAVVVPFTETFSADSAGWRDSTSTALNWFASGGDGGTAYVSGPFNFVNNLANDTPVILRGQSNFNSSGGAIFGNWIADGVTSFSIAVRHNAGQPLNFFSRFASPAAFPGAVAVNFAPVMPNTWTTLTFPIDPSNPQFISFEGSDFNTVFSNVGRVQVGVSVPASMAGVDQSFAFDLDTVSLVPAPGALALLGVAGIFVRRRR
ncbi:hypothetical protein PHYC_01800 [Phycisphaerales bacterium]|nr:hypothetical protein PHYC_01800 [Phycisphaerales bacterium]